MISTLGLAGVASLAKENPEKLQSLIEKWQQYTAEFIIQTKNN